VQIMIQAWNFQYMFN